LPETSFPPPRRWRMFRGLLSFLPTVDEGWREGVRDELDCYRHRRIINVVNPIVYHSVYFYKLKGFLRVIIFREEKAAFSTISLEAPNMMNRTAMYIRRTLLTRRIQTARAVPWFFEGRGPTCASTNWMQASYFSTAAALPRFTADHLSPSFTHAPFPSPALTLTWAAFLGSSSMVPYLVSPTSAFWYWVDKVLC